MIQRILVATDRSDTATRAVAWAAEMSGKYAAEVHTVNPEVEHYAGVFYFDKFLHPCQKPVTTVPTFGDYAGYLTHELSVSPHRSKTIIVEYRTH